MTPPNNPFSYTPNTPPAGPQSGPPGGWVDFELAAAEKQVRNGASWFFFVAVFSLLSSVLILTGGTYHSFFGLGTTELVSSVAAHRGLAGHPLSQGVGLAFDVLASGFYVLYGVYARQGRRWAFLTGLGFYVLDALLLLLTGRFLPLAFHAYAVFRIVQGLAAAGKLPGLRARQAPTGYVPLPPTTPPPGVWPPPPVR